MKSLRPLQLNNRISELDIFRGFAIFGIFMVNILVMNCGFTFRGIWESEQMSAGHEHAFLLLETLFYSKFFPVFSLLFGIGIALQFRKTKLEGNFSYSFFFRRFLALGLFGVAHILFIWSGDILHLYALVGFILLLFVNRSPRFTLWSTVLIFLFPYSQELFAAFTAFIGFDYQTPLAEINRPDIIELKRHGTYFSGVLLRIKEYKFASELLYAGIGQTALCMALLGLYLVKKGIVDNLGDFIKKKPFVFLSFVLSLLFIRFFLLYFVWPNFNIERGTILSISLSTLFILGEIATALFYLWLLTFLLQKDFWQRLLSPLKYVGRMAFTNYIFQSIVGYILMRTFSLYETFNPVQIILIVVFVFVFQIIMSKAWLHNFKYGPLEWLWRMISYWKFLPIKK